MDSKGQFRFDSDGKTVKEKTEDFEKKLNEYSSGVTQ
jgi:hypothetical protein